MPEPSYLYWDADVFLAYLNEEPGRIVIIESILEDVQNNRNNKIVTSVISKVEVAYIAREKLNQELYSIVEERIDALWNDSSVIEMVDFHDDIAILARSLLREAVNRGWRLKPNDAIHLASAEWAPVTELNTYNLRHLKNFGR